MKGNTRAGGVFSKDACRQRLLLSTYLTLLYPSSFFYSLNPLYRTALSFSLISLPVLKASAVCELGLFSPYIVQSSR